MCCVSRKLFRSSTFRLALNYMALFSASALLLLGFIYWFTAGYLVRQTDATIEAEIAGLAEGYRLTGLPGLTATLAERLARRPAGSSVYLLATPDDVPLLGNLEKWPAAARNEGGWLEFPLEGHGGAGGHFHKARAREFRLAGGFHLLVGRDVYDLEETQALIATTLAWGLAMTMVMALVGGVFMSRSMTRRIETINQTCRDIIYGDLSRRIPTRNSGDDFDQLVGNLNRMLDQIEGLMHGVRQVTDNIAHDLRSPLARLRNRLEQLKDAGSGPPLSHDTLEQAIAEADGLLATFGALLRIGRIEAGSREEGFAEVPLEELLRDVAELYEPLAEEKDQGLRLELQSGVAIRGDRDLLFQAFANVLDNAIKYTPVGGAIELRLQGDARAAQVLVADSGPGIPPEFREKVFQRFCRLEASRTTPGNGLGLSLVAAVAALHRGEVQLDENAPGLRVLLLFPGAD